MGARARQTRLVTGDYATADQFFAYILIDLGQAAEALIPRQVPVKLQSALRHMEDHSRLLRIANGEIAAQEMTTAEMVGAGILLAGVIVPVVVVSAEAAGLATLISAAMVTSRVTSAARLALLVCKYPVAASEITAIGVGSLVTFADSGPSPSHGLDAIFIYMAMRGRGPGITWSQVTARRSAGTGKPRFHVEAVKPVQGPPEGSTPIELRSLSVKRPASIPDLVRSARQEAELARSIDNTHAQRPACVSVILDPSGGEHPGASRMMRYEYRLDHAKQTGPQRPPRGTGPHLREEKQPQVLEAEVREYTALVETALRGSGQRGFGGGCAEPVSISNMLRQGVATKGAVSCAVNVTTQQVMDPCPNCKYLLRYFGMSWINRNGEWEQ